MEEEKIPNRKQKRTSIKEMNRKGIKIRNDIFVELELIDNLNDVDKMVFDSILKQIPIIEREEDGVKKKYFVTDDSTVAKFNKWKISCIEEYKDKLSEDLINKYLNNK